MAQNENTNSSLFSFAKCRNIACTEYAKWIFNPRLIIFGVMIVFIYDMVIRIMLQAADKMGTKLMITEPFVAVSNSVLLLLIMPAVFLGLMGDFPKTDGNSMFYIQRTGKVNWLTGQLIFSVMVSATFTFMVTLFSCLCIMGNCMYTNRWSDVTTKYVKTFPNENESMVVKLITGRLYNNIKPYQALFISFGMMVLYMVLISMMLLTGFAVGKRTAGIAVTSMILCIGSACVEFGGKIKWFFPVSHVLPWLHYDMVYKKQIFKMKYSVAYMVFMIVVLYLLDLLLIDRYDFSKITDMEE